MALSPNGKEADFPDSLSVLSTYYQPQVRQFTATGDTSAATAAAARLGALVRRQYPDLWPETIRALLIDSAEWTPHMKAEIASVDGADDLRHLLRCFGYGTPNYIGALSPETTSRLSKVLCGLLSKELDVPQNRIYLEFTSLEPHQFGFAQKHIDDVKKTLGLV